MNDITNFYDTLDLKYPEIGIAMQDIDRLNPGRVKFIIPVLTPDMDTSKVVEQKVHQTKSNLKNADRNLEIENISIPNYIEIPIPKELCAVSEGDFNVSEGTISLTGGSSSISDAYQSGAGSVSELSGFISVTGSISGTLNITNGNVRGTLNITPSDRYIEKGSKWIIVFVGGDITKPRVISRYIDD